MATNVRMDRAYYLNKDVTESMTVLVGMTNDNVVRDNVQTSPLNKSANYLRTFLIERVDISRRFQTLEI